MVRCAKKLAGFSEPYLFATVKLHCVVLFYFLVLLGNYKMANGLQ